MWKEINTLYACFYEAALTLCPHLLLNMTKLFQRNFRPKIKQIGLLAKVMQAPPCFTLNVYKFWDGENRSNNLIYVNASFGLQIIQTQNRMEFSFAVFYLSKLADAKMMVYCF